MNCMSVCCIITYYIYIYIAFFFFFLFFITLVFEVLSRLILWICFVPPSHTHGIITKPNSSEDNPKEICCHEVSNSQYSKSIQMSIYLPLDLPLMSLSNTKTVVISCIKILIFRCLLSDHPHGCHPRCLLKQTRIV
jgi:hypothetical protein